MLLQRWKNLIPQDIIQNVINEESKDHAPKSVRDMHGLITAVLKHNRVNLTINTVLPKKVRPGIYIPSDEEIKRLIYAVKDTDMELPVYLAAFGAMRRGEIAALTSGDVDGTIIHVSKTMVLDDNNVWRTKAPKSFAGDRYIEVPQFVAELLKGIKGRIVTMHPNRITARFNSALKKAELQQFRFHDLRHYNASISHALGMPDSYIMQTGGWGNDRVLKEVYQHTMEDRRKEINSIAINHFENMQHDIKKAP